MRNCSLPELNFDSILEQANNALIINQLLDIKSSNEIIINISPNFFPPFLDSKYKNKIILSNEIILSVKFKSTDYLDLKLDEKISKNEILNIQDKLLQLENIKEELDNIFSVVNSIRKGEISKILTDLFLEYFPNQNYFFMSFGSGVTAKTQNKPIIDYINILEEVIIQKIGTLIIEWNIIFQKIKYLEETTQISNYE